MHGAVCAPAEGIPTRRGPWVPAPGRQEAPAPRPSLPPWVPGCGHDVRHPAVRWHPRRQGSLRATLRGLGRRLQGGLCGEGRPGWRASQLRPPLTRQPSRLPRGPQPPGPPLWDPGAAFGDAGPSPTPGLQSPSGRVTLLQLQRPDPTQNQAPRRVPSACRLPPRGLTVGALLALERGSPAGAVRQRTRPGSGRADLRPPVHRAPSSVPPGPTQDSRGPGRSSPEQAHDLTRRVPGRSVGDGTPEAPARVPLTWLDLHPEDASRVHRTLRLKTATPGAWVTLVSSGSPPARWVMARTWPGAHASTPLGSQADLTGPLATTHVPEPTSDGIRLRGPQQPSSAGSHDLEASGRCLLDRSIPWAQTQPRQVRKAVCAARSSSALAVAPRGGHPHTHKFAHSPQSPGKEPSSQQDHLRNTLAPAFRANPLQETCLTCCTFAPHNVRWENTTASQDSRPPGGVRTPTRALPRLFKA